jgi:hypothetical protein
MHLQKSFAIATADIENLCFRTDSSVSNPGLVFRWAGETAADPTNPTTNSGLLVLAGRCITQVSPPRTGQPLETAIGIVLFRVVAPEIIRDIGYLQTAAVRALEVYKLLAGSEHHLSDTVARMITFEAANPALESHSSTFSSTCQSCVSETLCLDQYALGQLFDAHIVISTRAKTVRQPTDDEYAQPKDMLRNCAG